MTTQRKIRANRRNGSLSKGPKTTHGKEIASQNAGKHWLTAQVHAGLSIRDEARKAVRDEIVADAKPVGAIDRFYADRAAVNMCRRLGIDRLQNAIDREEELQIRQLRRAEFDGTPAEMDLPALIKRRRLLTRYDRELARQSDKDLGVLERRQKARRDGHNASTPTAVNVTVNAGAASQTAGTEPTAANGRIIDGGASELSNERKTRD